MSHESSLLQPVVRTENGCVDTSAIDDERARAFLQHDAHAETIIRFFLAQPYATGRAMSPCGMKIRVYTRWDSPTLDPDGLARVIGRVGNSGDPVVLDLHNNSGYGFTGVHYDPIFPCGQRAAAGEGAVVQKTTRNETGDSNNQVLASSSSRPLTKAGVKRETDQSSSTPKTTTIGAQNGDVVPPPPAPHPEQINRRKRQKTTPQTLPNAVVPTTDEVDQSTPLAGFYKLACMSPEQSPDPRCKVEVAVRALASQLRTDPTVPADPSNLERPAAVALRNDCAVQLPPKHCAFRHCGWWGDTDTALLAHLRLDHSEALEKVMSLLPACHTEEE